MMALMLLASCESRDELWLGEEDGAQGIVEEPNTEYTNQQEAEADEMLQATIFVHVCGQVVHPGVYELPTGSRVFEAVDMAGGCLEGADLCQVNQAAILQDGIKIYIPAQGEVLQDQQQKDNHQGLVNINQASLDELMTIPGIGESKAKEIIAYREKYGGFSVIEDLMEIPGIKEGIFTKIKEYITI